MTSVSFWDQLLEVVDLAVEDDDDGVVLVEQRLLAGGHVDDAQPAVAKPYAGLQVQAAFVRPAVGLRLVHAMQHMVRHGARLAAVEYTGDATHGPGAFRVVSRAALAERRGRTGMVGDGQVTDSPQDRRRVAAA
jgi:hypothetical protein